MAQQTIDFGSFPNDPSADPIRAAFQKVQNNFTELYQTTLSTGVVELVTGVGLAQNRTTGNITISANISNIRLSTGSSNSIVFGTTTTPTSGNVTTVSSITPIYVDLAPTITTVNANFTGNLRTANFSMSGFVTSSLLPATTEVYDLGSPSKRWRDLYLSGNSLNLGAVVVNADTANNAILMPNVVVSGNIAAGNVTADYVAGSLTTAVQPNITSVGTLAQLNVAGDLAANGNMTLQGSFSAGTIYGNVVLPPGATISSPGANMQVVFNDSGDMSAVPGLMFDKANTLLTIQGNIASDNLDITGDAAITGNIGVNKVVASGNIQGSNVVTLGVVESQTGITTGANLAITSISGDGTYVSVGFATQSTAPFRTGDTITISGVLPTTYNGTYTVVLATTSGITFSSTVTASASFAGARIRGNGNTTINGILQVVGNTSIGNISAVNKITGNIIELTGNVSASGLVALSANIANFNITSGGNVEGNIFTATLFKGSGANLTLINGANVTGYVPTSTTANISKDIQLGSFSNITGVGTLTSLTVGGDFSTNTGNSSIGGYLKISVNNAVAANGSTQGTATALTKTINLVTSVATGTAVRLPSSEAGLLIYVINDTNSAITVYPSSGQYIDARTQNTGFGIGPYGRMQFVGLTTSKFYTMTAIYA